MRTANVGWMRPKSASANNRSLDDNPNHGKKSGRMWEPDGDTFRRNVRLIARAKMLAYAGLDEDAQKLLPEFIQKKGKPSRRPIGTFEAFNTDLGRFEGTSVLVRYRDGTEMEIFKGISSQTRESFLKASTDKNESLAERIERSEFYEEHHSAFEKKSHWTKTDGGQNGMRVQSICRDGTILQVTIGI